MAETIAIRAKLQTGEAKIQPKTDGKSDVWQRFGLVVMADDTISEFVICLKCEALYKYDSHKTGTANLKRHSCPANPKQRPPQQVPPDQPFISKYAKVKVPLAAKSKLVDDFVDFCCKDAVNLHDQISKEFLNQGISAEDLAKVVFVTDQGPNIKAALKNHSWLPCSAHVINILLKHTFDDKDAPHFMCEVTDQIHKCKALVAYLKKSDSVLNLPYAVLQECETR